MKRFVAKELRLAAEAQGISQHETRRRYRAMSRKQRAGYVAMIRRKRNLPGRPIGSIAELVRAILP